eukprot:Tamp_12051.p1 GENE.Tamp_12051~~Tamp_12051.p1  ORF type:complete len:356 (+),score=63.68 Tamp_12051:49-1068(+)
MALRILVIDGFSGSQEGRRKLKDFLRAVARAIKQNNVDTEFHVIVRSLTHLHEFVFDPECDEQGRRQAMRNFSSIDLTFIGGEPFLLPWQTHSARLLAFVNQSVITGARVCGDLVAARALWHLSCTCGRQLQVVDVLENTDLPAPIPREHLPKAYAGRNTVMLQEISGEAFQLTEQVEGQAAREDGKLAGHVLPHTHCEVQARPGQVFREGTFVDIGQHHGKGHAAKGEVVEVAKKKAVPVRCCNVGMRKRMFQAPDAASSLALAPCRGLEQHWLMKDLLSQPSKPKKPGAGGGHAEGHLGLTFKPKPPPASGNHKKGGIGGEKARGGGWGGRASKSSV